MVFDIKEFEDFAEDLKDPSFDAGYVHIEPTYDVLDASGTATRSTRRGSVAAGERFIKATYEAIRNSPVWEKSLLIITWDEHGGFYDHVIPPRPKEPESVDAGTALRSTSSDRGFRQWSCLRSSLAT